MTPEQSNKTSTIIITTLISTVGLVCVAMIGLGAPFVQEFSKNYFATSTPYSGMVIATQANAPIAQASQPAMEQTVPTSTLTSSLPPLSLPAGYISLGEYYSGKVNSNGRAGDQVYSHFISGKIKYTRATADDDIGKIELVCTDKVIDITEKFSPIPIPSGENFPHYESAILEIPSNCRVDFYVVDTIGAGTGLTVYAEVVP